MRKHIAQFAVAGLTLYVMAQTLYWPFIRTPNTDVAWWQSYYAASIGEYVGMPVWALVLNSPFSGTPHLIASWVLVLLWVLGVYWLAGKVINVVRKHKEKEF